MRSLLNIKKQDCPLTFNICLVSKRFPITYRATSRSFLWPIARRLVQIGHKVTVLGENSMIEEFELTKEDVQIYFLHHSTSPLKSLKISEAVYQMFCQLHQKEPFHLVHSIDSSGYLIGKNKKKHGVAVSYDVEATYMSQIFSILAMSQQTLSSQLSTALAVSYRFLRTFYGHDRKILKTADGFFVASPQQKLALERYYLFPDAKTHMVPYGTEISNLEPKEQSQELRASLGISGSTKTLVTISDMTEMGEILPILQAFQKVAIKKPSTRMIIVGNGILRKKIEFEMLNLALGAKVILTGAINTSEITDFIALSDIFISLTSRTSGFDPVILEAMAQKKVIIGSELSPISTIVEDGLDGFLVRPADVQSIANLILEIFTNNISASEIGENAHNKIANLFDTEKIAQSTAKAFQKILLSSGLYRTKS